MKRKLIIVSVVAAAIAVAGLVAFFMRHPAPKPARVAAGFTATGAGAERQPEKKYPKTVSHPKVAIVIDDFGYTMKNVGAFISVKQPLTFSILPHLPHSAAVAELAAANGCEPILHLPLEPKPRKGVTLEPTTINGRMPRHEVLAKLDAAIASIPGLKGVSNHEGSMATEDTQLMTIIISRLKERGLYFFDSLTSQKSVCREVAASVGERYARRNIFLDNNNSVAAIRKQMSGLERYAFKNGIAIAICHDRKNTALVVSEMVPAMAAEGIEFVLLSGLEK